MLKDLEGGKDRIIVHVDFDYFFAQCEEIKDPTLKDKPVIVCIYSGRGSGAVSSSNYIARALGVKAGMPILQAKRIVKEGIFLKADLEFYEEKSKRIMSIIRKFGDKFEEFSIDEAFLDVSKLTQLNYDKALSLAKEMKREIYEKEGITCSVGIGPNKLIAKMASDYQKPNGLTVVKPNEVKDFLFPLPIGRLYGVGKKTEEKFLSLGIKTIGDLANYPLDNLISIFGKKLGTYFYLAANGIDHEEVINKESKEISRITTLKDNTLDFNEISKVLEELVKDVYSKMVKQGLACKSIGLLAIMENLKTHSKSKTFDHPTNNFEFINKLSKELLEEFLSYDWDVKVRRIGFKVFGLTDLKGQRLLTQYIK